MEILWIHISSYTLSQIEERLLCHGWDFCMENKVVNILEFETDIELNAMKIESQSHESVFLLFCRQLHNALQQLIRTAKNKKFSNLSDEELEAIKSLKSNENIVICKADKGNSIVILDKQSYIEKAQEILKGNQFQALNNSKFHQERENKLNKYIYSLFQEGIINQKLRLQL
ncbi:unnamed protein product [Rotaria sordida]|uniref:Uncharacterized protein n=1 Tax=Rotaria sordida TaxID=392033 RepID=A0A814BP63_9BILA|nr:unnamed protein product [Rotaria sordida]CAF1334743.1 unnamed protein product [Rotaria sordida]CAF1335395.1 unnamed protein product [Rotaria sordida]CAF3815616.1 unnamed protein product [Rotaria sordida]